MFWIAHKGLLWHGSGGFARGVHSKITISPTSVRWCARACSSPTVAPALRYETTYFDKSNPRTVYLLGALTLPAATASHPARLAFACRPSHWQKQHLQQQTETQGPLRVRRHWHPSRMATMMWARAVAVPAAASVEAARRAGTFRSAAQSSAGCQRSNGHAPAAGCCSRRGRLARCLPTARGGRCRSRPGLNPYDYEDRSA